MTRAQLELFDDLIGVHWREHGRDPATGLDCLGAVLVGLQRLGIDAQDPMEHLQERLRWVDSGRDSDAFWPRGWHLVWPVNPRTLQVGDVGVIDSGGGVGGHLALWIGEGWWLTCNRPSGVHKVSWDAARPRLMKVRRWRAP